MRRVRGHLASSCPRPRRSSSSRPRSAARSTSVPSRTIPFAPAPELPARAPPVSPAASKTRSDVVIHSSGGTRPPRSAAFFVEASTAMTFRSAAHSAVFLVFLFAVLFHRLTPGFRRDSDGRADSRPRHGSRMASRFPASQSFWRTTSRATASRSRPGWTGGTSCFNVPANPYHLTANVQGFTPFHADVDVRGSAPLVHDIILSLAEVRASTTVEAQKEPVELESDDPSTHIDIDKSLIRRSAAAIARARVRVDRHVHAGFFPGRKRPVPLSGRPFAAAPRHRRPAHRRPDRDHVLELPRSRRRREPDDHHGRHSRRVR